MSPNMTSKTISGALGFSGNARLIEGTFSRDNDAMMSTDLSRALITLRWPHRFPVE